MYFMDQKHELNFMSMLNQFPTAEDDPEYRAACYIVSVPEVFKKIQGKTAPVGTPFDWIYVITYAITIETGEAGQEYEIRDIDYKCDAEGNELYSDNYKALSSSYKELVNLGRNLFNNYEFSLNDGLATWDDKLYQVALQAINIRRGD